MKTNKILFIILMTSVLSFSSCRDKFAEINQDPSSVTIADPSYLMAEAIRDFQTNDYLLWFYNCKYFGVWDQMGASGAFKAESRKMGATGGQGSQSITMLRYRNDINNLIKNGNPKYGKYAAVCDVLAIYCAIFDTDVYGDIPYSEAAMFRYGGKLTPKYDRLDSLYTGWVKDLDNDIATFKNDSMMFVASEDIIFNGKMERWEKLANSIKLKIAVRMYLNKPSEAKTIVESVVNSSVGYIDKSDDDFLFNKADVVTNNDGDVVYQTGNTLEPLYASANMLDFMRENLDPRIRFIYTKNSFNSKIVQEFLKENKRKDLPTYIKEHANFNGDSTQFLGWKAPGEPWVRYIGMPMVKYDSPEYNKVKDEFFVTTGRYELKIDKATKTYEPMSKYNEEMMRGRCEYTLPTLPGEVKQDIAQHPWWGMYLTTAETNLYLAEFKLLGADLPQTAEYYYNRGVMSSVEEYDYLAKMNQIPYYGTTYDYDTCEVKIDLVDGEIKALMEKENIKLTGSTEEKLEKVYLQQLIHFSMMPDEQFVTSRRSGYPKIGSKLVPFVVYEDFPVSSIPRRFELASPNPSDIMYDIKMEAYKVQGLTPGTSQSGGNKTYLNDERLWQDPISVQWGTPPSL